MFDFLAGAARSLLGAILPLYRDTDFAYAIAGVMGIVALVLIAIALAGHLIQTRALSDRTQAITNFLVFGATNDALPGNADETETLFTKRYREIDASLRHGGRFVGELPLAWRRYSKTLSFSEAPPIRSNQPPAPFFQAATPPPTWLGFAANLFVGFGLLATFLGLVAALTFATEGMTSSDPQSMQAALRDLLASAASKFVTSVAGVGLSIILRLVERLLTIRLRERVRALSNAIEAGIRVDPDAHGAALTSSIQRLVNGLERPVQRTAQDEAAAARESA